VDWDELTRWSHINQALSLGFDEPRETYSSSEHLFEELGISKSVAGRVAKPKVKSEIKPEVKVDKGPRQKRERVRTKRVR
jgi:hypothetical protein